MASKTESRTGDGQQPDALREAAAGLLASFESGDPDAIEAETEAFLAKSRPPLDLLVLFSKLSEKAEATGATIRIYERILRLNPMMPDLHRKLGQLQLAAGQRGAAMRTLNTAIKVREDDLEARKALAGLLLDLGRHDEARRHYQACTEAAPEDSESWLLLANCCRIGDRTQESIEAFDKAIELDADLAEAHVGKAGALLSLGDFANGWREYNWRPDGLPRDGAGKPVSAIPSFAGKRVLLGEEASIGRTVLGLRYASLLREAGARVTLAVNRSYMRLLLDSDLADDMVEPGEGGEEYDYEMKLLSAAAFLRTGPGTQPLASGYITPGARLRSVQPDRLKVGIALGSGPDGQDSPIPVARLREILTMDAPVRFISLEASGKEDFGNISWANGRISLPVADLDDPRALAETIADMDLVIAAGGPAGHLAGAMGVRCWLILPVNADWAWGSEGDRTPWYNSIRIFRQTVPGRWSRPLELVRKSLQTLALVTNDPAMIVDRRPAPKPQAGKEADDGGHK
jgi:tetratricopeptide (TPR) repeat protein